MHIVVDNRQTDNKEANRQAETCLRMASRVGSSSAARSLSSVTRHLSIISVCSLFFLFFLSVSSLYSQQMGLQKIQYLEYFIDTDPGVGKATRISGFTPAADVNIPIDNIHVSHLSEGIHRVFVRAVTDSAHVSITQHRTFYRTKIRTVPNVMQLEYFVDTDPGIGKAKKINIASPGTNVNEYPVNIELDEAASGAHTLYIRARDASGKWSITQQRTFQQFYERITPNLTGLEYFIDTDPDFGKGEQLSLSGTEENRLFSVDITNLDAGMHTLYVRSRNEFFFWSITQSITFVKANVSSNSEITGLEYFIDSDPGFGKAKSVNIVSGKNITAHFDVVPDTLDVGLHTLYLRARNADGRWTVTQDITFMKMDDGLPADIVGYEWFIDTDPGFGKASSFQSVTATAQLSQTFVVDVSALDEGMHTMYVRVLDKKGNWSITQKNTFIRAIASPTAPVTALEWFIDTDPGFGQAQPVPATEATVNIPVNTQLLEPGIHTLYVRAKNTKGDWSITHDITFIQIETLSPSKITAYEWFIDTDPGFGRASSFTTVAPVERLEKTIPIHTSDIDAGLHHMFVRVLDENGNWSITQTTTFLKSVKISTASLSAMEWFIDTDPGFGAGEPIALSGTAGDHSFILNLTSMMEGGLTEGLHNLYVRAKNDKGQWGIAQHVWFNLVKDEQPISNITEMEWFIGTDPGYGNVPSSQRFVYATPQRVVIQPFQVDVSSLSEGWHNLYVRAKNVLGFWSVTQHQSFIKVRSRGLAELEYFIDTDKGFGRNTLVPISGDETIVNLSIDASSLDNGIHTLYVRARNEADAWGVTQMHTFVKVSDTHSAPGVKGIEWFVDTDPGFGKAKTIATGAGNTALIHIDEELAEGLHTLYVRSVDNLGIWSLTQNISFFTLTVEDTPDIVALEWFIDTDLGVGNTTSVPVTPDRNITKKITIPVANLAEGMHHIYVRAKDSNGAWSLTQYVPFRKINLRPDELIDLRRMEYFIDTDLGFGAGTNVILSGQGADESLNISLNNVPAGFHTLYVRTENKAGKWSITQSIPFLIAEIPEDYVIPDVTALEYFIDKDPGYGQAQKIYFDRKGPSVQKTFAVDITGISAGLHTFYVRAVNETGKWGITHYTTFIKSDIPENYELPKLVRLEYFIDSDPGFGLGEPVDLPSETSTGTLFRVDLGSYEDGPHTLYVRAIDENGKWTITQSIGFYRTDIPVNINKDIVYMEYFINDDPGFGKAEEIVIANSAEEVNQTVFIPTDNLWPGAYTIYFRALDARGLWSITQDINIMVIDNPRLGGYPDIVALEYFFDDDPGFGNAERIKVEPAGININQRIFIPMDDMPEGMHTLYIRGVNSKGEWTHTNDVSIYNTGAPRFDEMRNVVGFEYFINTDPGFGKAKYFAAQSPDIMAQQRITVNVDTLKEGLHTMYVRAVDNMGEWSQTQRNTFLRVRVRPEYPVTALEYFIDNDPGFGKGKQITVTQSTNINRTFNVELPDTLSLGVHTLYVRARNTENEWSITHSTDFTKIQIRHVPELAAMEYFIDTDPGFGAGETMPVPGDAPVTMFIPLNNLEEGPHTLYIRAMNTEGVWSVTQYMDFFTIHVVRDIKVTDIEYFVDNDPGFGKAAKVQNITPATSIDRTFVVNLDTLDAGLHTLYVRALDEKGNWSITQHMEFIRLEDIRNPNIVKAEYFIDEAKEFGSGVDIPVTAGAWVQSTVTVNTASLDDGFHTIFVRVKDSYGAWSITQHQQFIKQSKHVAEEITAMEWFIDSDPGFGNANTVTVSGSTVTFPVHTLALDAGIHTLYVRTKNTRERWSITQDITFIRLEEDIPANIVAYEWFIDTDPGFGLAPSYTVVTPEAQITRTVQVDVSGLAPGMHHMFVRVLDDRGAWSIAQHNTFVRIQVPGGLAVTTLEWFIDTDPGFGNANPISVTSGTVTIPFTADDPGAGLHTLYVRAMNEAGQWSITQDISFIRMAAEMAADIVAYEWFIDTDPGFGQASSYTTVSPTKTLSETVQVNVSGIEPGLHNMFVRVLDNQGNWSVTQHFVFLKTEKRELPGLVAMEYFIDTDPGFGQAERIAMTEGNYSYILNLTSLMEGNVLNEGLHTLYIRAVNEAGQWSITQDITFNLIKDEREIADIEEIEWFIGDDPGYGNVPSSQRFVYATPQRVIIQPFQVDVSSLPEGWHNLYVRAKNEKGKWSVTQYQPFLKMKSRELAFVEYFIDEDKGFGMNTMKTVSGEEAIIQIDLTAAGLSEGIHTLYVRAQNQAGAWGVTQYHTFVKVSSTLVPSETEAVEWFIDTDPGFGGAKRVAVAAGTSLINVQASDIPPGGMHTLYVRALNKDGAWGVSQHFPFYVMEVEQLPEITALEWFIDTDPGVGGASYVAVDAGQNISKKVTVPVSGLDDGMHRIYVRTRDSRGAWSITQYTDFIRISAPASRNIVEMEYFIDDDPGFGNALKVSNLPQGTTSTAATFVVDIYNITEGVHSLYVRSKDEAGNWSITHSIEFVKIDLVNTIVPGLSRIEYFFDKDPGYGSGTSIPLTGIHTSKTFAAQLPADIREGIHTLYVRAQDTLGHWGHTQYSQFIKIEKREIPNTVAIEYFIDKDPGFGKAVRKTFAPNTSVTQNLNIGLDTVPEGMHTLYVRALDATGKWSLTHDIDFLKVLVEAADPAEVAYVEWFLDNDPGHGKANAIPAFTAATSVSQTFPITLTGIDNGVHNLYVRARDHKDRWGVTHWQSFLKTSVKVRPKVTAIEWFLDSDPGFGNANQVDINPSEYEYTAHIYIRSEDIPSMGVHTLYVRTLDEQDHWSITQTMDLIVLDMKKQEASKTMALEYFFDTDPGFGNGKRVNISPTTTDADRRFMISGTELSALSEGVHTLYIRAQNEDEKWSITHSIHIVKVSDIQKIPDDVVRIEYFIDDDPGFGKGKPVPVSPANDIDKLFAIDLTGVSMGVHTLYIRAINSSGKWSITTFDIEIETKDIPPVEPEGEPVGGVLTPSSSEVCENQSNPASVTLTLNGYDQRIWIWQYRHYREDGSMNFTWRQVQGTSRDRESLTFRPDQPGTWEYRVAVTKGDRGPEYSTIAKIKVIGAAQGGKVTATTPEYVCSGKSFTVTLEEYKGDIVRWQHRLVFEGDTSSWLTIPGSGTAETIPVTPASGGEWQYRAEVEMGECSNAFSEEAKVKVIDATTGGHIEPATLTSCVGKNFELEAKDYLGDIVSWQRSTDGGNTWTTFTHTDKYYNVTLTAVGEVQYRAVVKAGNCDDTWSEPAIITVLEEVGAAQDIIGDPTPCKPGTQVLYRIPAIPHVESYEWTIPAGVTFDGADNGNEVYLNFTGTAVSGEITVRGYTELCGYGEAASLSVIVYERPATPVITGAESVCAGQQYTYSVPLNNNETYSWTLPVGWTILSGENTNMITVIPTGISGEISVTVTNTDTGCISEPGKKMLILLPSAETGPIYRLPNL